MKVSIGEASRILGVAQVTLRRWEREGKLHPERTEGGQRRYDLDQLIGQKVAENDCERITIAYARVSSHVGDHRRIFGPIVWIAQPQKQAPD